MNGGVPGSDDCGGTEMDDVLLGRTQYIKETGSPTHSNRNWQGVLISLLVIAVVLGLIAYCVFLLTPVEDGPNFSGERFTLDDIISGKFDPPKFKGQWLSENEFVYLDDYGGISLMNVSDLNITSIISNVTYRHLKIEDFEVSPDREYLLLRHHSVKNHNLHQGARYSTLKINLTDPRVNNEVGTIPLTPYLNNTSDYERHPELLYVTWTTSHNGSNLIMVFKHDIYLKNTDNLAAVSRLTFTGDETIYNGVTDFLYKEFILHATWAMWVSTDGSKLVYASFNDSRVMQAHIPLYTSQYSSIINVRYPKVDTINPLVSLWVQDLYNSSAVARDLKPPNRVKNQSVGEWFVDHLFLSCVLIVNCCPPIVNCTHESCKSTRRMN